MSADIHGRHPLLSWVVVIFTLSVFALTVIGGRNLLQSSIRTQITEREGEVLYAVTQMLQLSEGPGNNPIASVADPDSQLHLLLETSKLKGVIAARLFDASGTFLRAFPPGITETTLPDAVMETLNQRRPKSVFDPAVELQEIFENSPASGSGEARIPLMEVYLPIHPAGDRQLVGMAQFIIDGTGIAGNFAALDRQLNRQAMVVLVSGGAGIAVVIFLAFRRLNRQNRRLVKANQELALNAKTSAVGSITSHLIHGLKNPLFALENFFSENFSRSEQTTVDPEWQGAMTTAHRMRNMITDISQVLRCEEGTERFDMTVAEVVESAFHRVSHQAQSRQLKMLIADQTEVVVDGRTANLLVLVLVNLLENSIAVSSSGGTVLVEVSEGDGACCIDVKDHGSGISPEIANSLFTSFKSTKDGGSGLGLAISRQLTKAIGGEITVLSSNREGTTFRVRVPTSRPVLLESIA